jgi:hypothetical protein
VRDAATAVAELQGFLSRLDSDDHDWFIEILVIRHDRLSPPRLANIERTVLVDHLLDRDELIYATRGSPQELFVGVGAVDCRPGAPKTVIMIGVRAGQEACLAR